MERKRLKAKGILFDLDGTIVDARKAYLQAAKTAFTELGRKEFDINLVLEIPKRFEQSMPLNDLLTGIDVESFQKHYLEAYYQATASCTIPFPNVADTLKMLSNKAKLALTTRRHVPKKTIIEELERFDLARYFQHVATALDTLKPKPAPEALIQCSEQLDVGIGECVVVGDSVVDVRAGKNAGAMTVAVLSGIFSREELERENPGLILESVKKLPYFIE